jgi:hypothetical protein
MGRAARMNPISHDGGKDPNAVAMARIIRGCSFIKTPAQLEKVLDRICAHDPEARRDVIRDFMWDLCTFDAAAIAHEDEQRRLAERRAAAYTIPRVGVSSDMPDIVDALAAMGKR